MGSAKSNESCYFHKALANYFSIQRQTIVSQFYQLDRLVVEGGKTVCHTLSAPAPMRWFPDRSADTLLTGQTEGEKQ